MSKRLSCLSAVAWAAALLAVVPSACASDDGSAPGTARVSDGRLATIVPASHSHGTCAPPGQCGPGAAPCVSKGYNPCRSECDSDGCCLHRLLHRDRCDHHKGCRHSWWDRARGCFDRLCHRDDCDDCGDCDHHGCRHWLCQHCGWQGTCLGGLCPHCGILCHPCSLLHMFHPCALLHGLRQHGHGLLPVGVYSQAYPANPNYFDPRDGRVYAAQGYGIPVSVPLAPQVDFTYNYGWGIPASRLTPIWK